jgi:hypothetical protein
MMENTHKLELESAETATETSATKTVAVELTERQYAFLTGWQKTHEQELGIKVPIGALVRKAVETAMNSAQRPQRDSKSGFGSSRDGSSRPSRAYGASDRPDRNSKNKDFSFSDRRPPRGKTQGRPSVGGRGPKFDMLASAKPRRFDGK